jgi:hypothetical protein
MMLTKSYRNLILLPTFRERFEYLKLAGTVGESTFGFDRYLNQRFYQSREWRQFRSKVIARDEGNDMGIKDYPISGTVFIHHINPLSVKDFEEQSDLLFDMNNVICVSHNTHEAIHYGDESLLPKDPIERKPNDTIPWKG